MNYFSVTCIIMSRTSYIQWWWWCLLCSVWIFIVLADWNNSMQVDASLHSVLILSQQVFVLLKDLGLGKKQQIPFYSFCLTRSGLEATIYHTSGEHVNNYTIAAVQLKWKQKQMSNIIHYGRWPVCHVVSNKWTESKFCNNSF